MIDKYIQTLRPFVLELFEGDSTGHDISHLERTLKASLYLCEKEGGDKVIVGLAAFLHDIHRIMQNKEGKFVSPRDSLPAVKNILSRIDLTEEEINKICYCIEYHEEYNWNGHNVSDKNTLILQDADNLDAIGAIGIARTFSFGGAHNIKMYDDNVSFNEKDNYEESMGTNESTIHHFYHKLFKLEDNMNTKTAKKLAHKRTKFMHKFTDEFLKEWHGNY